MGGVGSGKDSFILGHRAFCVSAMCPLTATFKERVIVRTTRERDLLNKRGD